MALEIEKLLDDTGWQLLHALQQNARLSYSELGQRVGLSSPAVAERIHRMEDAGIISGYHVEINRSKLGYPITAIIRMSTSPGDQCSRFATFVQEIPDRKSTRLNSSHTVISYAVFCLKKKNHNYYCHILVHHLLKVISSF